MRLLPIAPLVLLTLGCAGVGAAVPQPTRSPAASFGAIPADWPTLNDATFGFSLRYPTGWTQQFDQPPGFHALASRADLTNLLQLQAQDYWFVAQAGPKDPSAGCGEPSGGAVTKSTTALGGETATRYVITGSQGGATQHIVDVVMVRGSTCYTLQLVAGAAIPLDRELSTLQEIQTSYRLS